MYCVPAVACPKQPLSSYLVTPSTRTSLTGDETVNCSSPVFSDVLPHTPLSGLAGDSAVQTPHSHHDHCGRCSMGNGGDPEREEQMD